MPSQSHFIDSASKLSQKYFRSLINEHLFISQTWPFEYGTHFCSTAINSRFRLHPDASVLPYEERTTWLWDCDKARIIVWGLSETAKDESLDTTRIRQQDQTNSRVADNACLFSDRANTSHRVLTVIDGCVYPIFSLRCRMKWNEW